MQELQVDAIGLAAGVDGCKGGWIVSAATPGELGQLAVRVVPAFEDIWDAFDSHIAVLAVDMPIGLVNEGARAVESLARKRLGSNASSIFTPPERILLEFASLNGHLGPNRPGSYEDSWEAVNDWSKRFLGHGVAQQSFGIWPKIAEIDRYMLDKRDPRVHESHPELVFIEMNQGQPLGESKRTAAGSEARGELLSDHLSGDLDLVGLRNGVEVTKGAGIDDLYDSLALLWTADRINSGIVGRIPEVVDYDPSGLDMAMWF